MLSSTGAALEILARQFRFLALRSGDWYFTGAGILAESAVRIFGFADSDIFRLRGLLGAQI